MEKNNMFIKEDINTVYVNIDTAIENAGISYVEGDEKEAKRYKDAVEEVYKEIGKAVLQNRDVAQKIQALLRGEEIQEEYKRPDVWVLCESLYNGKKEWYVWGSKSAVKEGDIIETYEADLPGRAKVLKVMYSAEPAGDIGPDVNYNENHYDNPAHPGQVLCALVEERDDGGDLINAEWYRVASAIVPSFGTRVDFSCMDHGMVISTEYLPVENTQHMYMIGYKEEWQSWVIVAKPLIEDDEAIPF